jgi:hypothetical protein
MRNRTIIAGTALGTASVLVYREVFTPWHQRWGATADELSAPLPGDDLVAEPAEQVTRAITIDAEPADVWPWLDQIGADRGGFYSYDCLENLFGLDVHSADEVVEEWQDLEVGDVVWATRKRSGGWYVVRRVPGSVLALQMADLEAGRPVRRDTGGWEFLWTFALRADDPGRTRLIVRERVAFGSRLTRWLMAPTSVVSFVMTRRMMLGIKERAEAQLTRRGGPAARPAGPSQSRPDDRRSTSSATGSTTRPRE